MSTSLPYSTAVENPPETRPQYPPLPPHVLERLAGYIGPGLRKRMALRREAQAAEAHAPTA
jgi:hypothetical protein